MRVDFEQLLFQTSPTIELNSFFDIKKSVPDYSLLPPHIGDELERLKTQHNIRLTKDQLEAVLYNEGNLLIQAGAGSGKTSTITVKIKMLCDVFQVHPKEICLVTFTKEASREMKERLLKIIDHPDASTMTVGTFHSIFGKSLTEYLGKNIFTKLLTDDEYNTLLRLAIKDSGFDIRDIEIADLKNQITLWKNEIILPSDVPFDHEYFNIYANYERLKKDTNKMDYDDIQLEIYDYLLTDEFFYLKTMMSYKYVCIDEFQDINKVQKKIIELMLGPGTKIVVVGDPNQAIYSFRGSNSGYILDFQKEYKSHRIMLDINFRSSEAIVQIAKNVIAGNKFTLSSNLQSVKQTKYFPSFKLFSDDIEEARFIVESIKRIKDRDNLEYKDIAILVRNHFYSDMIIHLMSEEGIPFSVEQSVSSIYNRPAIKAMVGVMRAMQDENNMEAIRSFGSWFYISNVMYKELKKHKELSGSTLLRSLENLDYRFGQKPDRQIDRFLRTLEYAKSNCATPYDFVNVLMNRFLKGLWSNKEAQGRLMLEDLEVFLASIKRYSTFDEVYERIQESREEIENAKKETNGVVVSTIHGAKGLEWHSVFVPGHIDGILPSKKSKDIIEETNLEYVALTRAKERLVITAPEEHSYSDTNQVSPFVSSMKFKHFVSNRNLF